MRAVCLYLHLHQPWRYHEYSIFDVAHNFNYWYTKDQYSGQNNERIFKKVAAKSYHPMLDLLEKCLRRFPEFKISLSITGTWLEQAAEWDPELIEQIDRMISTGQVEIVGETYYHSLAFFYNKSEFVSQVRKHSDTIARLFGVRPRVFRNTELAYNNEVGKWAAEIGYNGILAEGWDKVLGWHSPNHVYKVAGANNCKLLLKNYRLSDDLAFRFSDKKWEEWPLTVEKYINWLCAESTRGNLINLFMDFETFGEHQWAESGIFKFFEEFVYSWTKEVGHQFLTVSEACEFEQPMDEISMNQTTTWADTERDLSAWCGNDMQKEALAALYGMYDEVVGTGDGDLLDDWRRLSTSDHTYYMCTKYWNDGDVHAYFSPYASPYEAFMYFMNVLKDFDYRIKEYKKTQRLSQ